VLSLGLLSTSVDTKPKGSNPATAFKHVLAVCLQPTAPDRRCKHLPKGPTMMIARLYFSVLGVAILVACAFCLSQLNFRNLLSLPGAMTGYSVNGLKLLLKDPFMLTYTLVILIVLNAIPYCVLGLTWLSAGLSLLVTFIIVFNVGLIKDITNDAFGPV
jgi:hypothetical protein